jgi:hypothetical protein
MTSSPVVVPSHHEDEAGAVIPYHNWGQGSGRALQIAASSGASAQFMNCRRSSRTLKYSKLARFFLHQRRRLDAGASLAEAWPAMDPGHQINCFNRRMMAQASESPIW